MLTKVQAGFDLTSFGEGTAGAEKFREVLRLLGLPEKAKRFRGKGYEESEKHNLPFVFSRPGLRLIVGNNPLTGRYYIKGMRKNGLGYASYIGLEGNEKLVTEAYNSIATHAEYIKEAEFGRRSFI